MRAPGMRRPQSCSLLVSLGSQTNPQAGGPYPQLEEELWCPTLPGTSPPPTLPCSPLDELRVWLCSTASGWWGCLTFQSLSTELLGWLVGSEKMALGHLPAACDFSPKWGANIEAVKPCRQV